MALEFFGKLLTNAVMQQAETASVPAAYIITNQYYNQAAYTLKVLRAPVHVRAAVLAAAAASEFPGANQVANILRMYNTLTKRQQIDFIQAYRRTAVLVIGAPRHIALRTAWQWNHIPPRYDP